MKRKKNVIKIARWKKVLYLGGFVAGVVLSVVLIFLAYCFGNDPLINYFLGFSSSLIITVIFAYLLELISLQEQNNKRKNYRLSWLSPIADCVKALFYRAVTFVCTCTGEKREYRYEDFSELLKNAFDFYYALLEGKNNRHKMKGTIDDAKTYKFGVERFFVEFMTIAIKRVLDNVYVLVSEGILSEDEIDFLNGLLETSQRLNFPGLGATESDEGNVSKTQNATTGLVNNSSKEDFRLAVDLFSMALDDAMLGVEEMSCLENLAFKPR